MQFTVIGAAANEAARLAGMCKDLKRWVLALLFSLPRVENKIVFERMNSREGAADKRGVRKNVQ
jgi:hypothetical protein